MILAAIPVSIVAMLGYMFWNAHYRMQSRLEPDEGPAATDGE